MRPYLPLIGAIMCCLFACDSTAGPTNEASKSPVDKQDHGAKQAASEPAVAPTIAPADTSSSADDAREQCIRDCVEAKKMEARAPEAIEADCSHKCETTEEPTTP